MTKIQSRNATLESRNRISARVSQNVSELIEAAANTVGATVNQFVINAAVEKAESIVEREFIFKMSSKGMEQFLDLIDNPPPPNAALIAAHERYERRRLTDVGASSTFEFHARPK